MTRPPCWPAGQPCPNNCAHELYRRTIYNQTPLYGPWAGWRMAGEWLIDPDGLRINHQRVLGLIWRERQEARLAAARARAEAQKRVSRRMVTVIRIDNRDWHQERFGTVAG